MRLRILTGLIPALFFLVLLVALFSASLWQCHLHCGNNLRGKWLNGQITSRWEKDYLDTLPNKEFFAALWEILRYHLFKTGSKGVVIGAQGWLFTDEEFIAAPDSETNFTENITEINRIEKLLRKKNIRLVVAVIPAKARIASQFLLQPLPRIRQLLYDRINLPPQLFVDGRGAFSSLSQPFFRTDTHWTPVGAQAMANAVADHVKKYYPVLAKDFTASFHSRPVGKKTFYSDLHKFLPEGVVKAESYTAWETITDADDLFSNEKIPVALVGTSYSADERWNFIGFLKEALHADAVNYAQQGKGAIAPMRDFIKHIPPDIRLVVWEFPERFLPLKPQESR